MSKMESQRGAALITVLLLVGMVTALLSAYFFLTRVEFFTTKSVMGSNRGFYVAEAGVNIRSEQIRQEFIGYRRPSGTPATPAPGQLPCRTGDPGDGEFGCQTYTFRGREALTYVVEDPTNPSWIVIPPGERFQNLNAQVYRYGVRSVAVNFRDEVEAILNLQLLTNLVPLFQFAVFYDKDLEILPGPPMFLEGPVHTNGDLYVGAGSTLTIEGQVSTAGRMFHGRKNSNACSGNVAVYDPVNPQNVPGCSGGRTEIVDGDVGAWNGMIRLGMDRVIVPQPEEMDPDPGRVYWDRADLRIMLDLDTNEIEVRNADGTPYVAASDFLNNGCGMGYDVVGSTSGEFYNFREGAYIEMLEIDLGDLFNCIELDASVQGGRTNADATDDGLVWYFGVEGPDSGVYNNYGVRVKNGARLGPTVGPTEVRGLTIATNQAFYVEGDYNSDADWVPAAFLADSLNVLSNGWSDLQSDNPLPSRDAADTSFFVAFLSGTDVTGNVEGVGGQDAGDYNGGIENYPRFHETWSGDTLTYRGSFVSLGTPRHVDGAWSDQSYSPPIRDWRYELRFNDASNLPPLSPRMVYLKQDQFLREYDLDSAP